MEKFNNYKIFIDKLSAKEIEVPYFFNDLIAFTKCNSIKRKEKLVSEDKIIKKNSGYTFFYNGREIFFSLLSEEDNISLADKKILEDINMPSGYVFRPLKLACSLDLANPHVILTSSSIINFGLLITYQKSSVTKVIDYRYNLIMDYNDYKEIFKSKELNVMDKSSLYKIYILFKFFDFKPTALQYLTMFSEEIFNDLSRNSSYFKDKYDESGINFNNDFLYANDCDDLFFNDIDYMMKNDDVLMELATFTTDPSKFSEHILYDDDKKLYKYSSLDISFSFNLLSNIINNNLIRNEVLSCNRYHHCHENVHYLAYDLDIKDLYIVSGCIKINEFDYYYHSWIEYEDLVLDYNNNLVMGKSVFYNLFEVKEISRTIYSDMQSAKKMIYEDAKLNSIGAMLLNYFGIEIKENIVRSKVLLQ